MSFKIIAIKPLENCSSEHLKVLTPNQIFYLYRDYLIKETSSGHEKIEYNSKAPEDLFNVMGKGYSIDVNISAIVGKNGSGKSTLVELLFKAINNIASNFKLEEGNPNKTIIPDIIVVKGVSLAFYYQRDNKIYKVTVNDSDYKIYRFNKTSNNEFIIEREEYLDFNLDELFYTEVINYSHYAYNSDIEGKWIEKLFHKNDSYQTPVVFNPMRTRGDTTINRENDLVRQRLLVNILRIHGEGSSFNFRHIGDNLTASNIKLTLKSQRDSVEIYPKKQINFGLSKFNGNDRNSLLEKSIQVIIDPSFTIDKRKNEIDKKVFDNARAYILYKLISISIKYDGYKRYFLKTKKTFKELDVYLGKLKKDNSHITFKLRQTLYFIYFNHFSFDFKNDNFYKLNDLSKSISDRINESNSLSIIELIPPPIFDTEILLENKDRLEVNFKTLSSGEKQLIYSVSSILYHLTNLDSVSNDKIQYRNVNIVMEEIELYFHPDLQRRFISYLSKGINDIQLKNLKAINICFITHSPFILSDIPSNNVMFLKVNDDGKSEQNRDLRRTFGANIHDILYDSFFFEGDIYIGELVKNKIDEFLEEISDLKSENKKGVLTKKILNNERIIYLKKLISIIDEKIIKVKLSEMLGELIEDNSIHNEIIDIEIKHLESLKKNNNSV